jgi:tetratricopeptide (TPR) repeat protein
MNFAQRSNSFAMLGVLTTLTLFVLSLPLIAFAAGDSNDSGTPNTSKSMKKDGKIIIKKADDKKKKKKKEFVIKCFGKNKIFDKTKKRCVEEEEAQTLNQDSIYSHGRSLAHAGRYEDAIRVLKLAHDGSDPRVLNYLGYSNRKLGNMDKALIYYHAVVASNPDFSLVREYLGEAYIQLGLLEKAREQLTQIERICGNKTCREYALLTKFMVESQIR